MLRDQNFYQLLINQKKVDIVVENMTNTALTFAEVLGKTNESILVLVIINERIVNLVIVHVVVVLWMQECCVLGNVQVGVLVTVCQVKLIFLIPNHLIKHHRTTIIATERYR